MFLNSQIIWKDLLKMNKNNEQICPTWKTGQDTYLLDNQNPFCPYIHCHNGKACSMYVPLKHNTEQDIKRK